MTLKSILRIGHVFALLGLLGLAGEAATIQPACTKEDEKLAINAKNKKFPKIMDNCASDAWGNKDKTSACLKKKYPTLSQACTSCFGQMADCSASNCKWKCVGNHFSDSCLSCVDSHCRGVSKNKGSFSLTKCTGLKADKLPPAK